MRNTLRINPIFGRGQQPLTPTGGARRSVLRKSWFIIINLKSAVNESFGGIEYRWRILESMTFSQTNQILNPHKSIELSSE